MKFLMSFTIVLSLLSYTHSYTCSCYCADTYYGTAYSLFCTSSSCQTACTSYCLTSSITIGQCADNNCNCLCGSSSSLVSSVGYATSGLCTKGQCQSACQTAYAQCGASYSNQAYCIWTSDAQSIYQSVYIIILSSIFTGYALL